MHRLIFFIGLLSADIARSAPDVLPPLRGNRPAFTLTAAQGQRLRRALEPYHQKYDASAQMLKEPFRSPGYHTTLKGGYVHSTRSSLHYAVALLDTGEPDLLARAEDILRKVISLQDQDPASKTYGIWSWFLEEPLDKMSPPDWNWADFCGTTLLQVALDHRRRLSPALAREVDAAIQHAARSIKKRNVGPGYTNIAIMGAYVTLVAGELYNWEEMREYGLARWRQFYEHTKKHGAFNEYNSPTYTIVALEELGRMRQHVQNPEARQLTEEIYRRAWEEIAWHFHAPTRQWAGPHSRCYSTLLSAGTLALLRRATEGRVNLGPDNPTLDEARLPLACPRDLEKFFTELPEPRELRQSFIAGTPPVIGTTYLAPAFTLGSVNRSDLWNQRRALVAYWGNEKQPAYLHLRLLHDNYDFAAAQLFSVQQRGRVLVGLNFSTDGGDRHVTLDRIQNATVRARDLRLRFEFGGAAGKARPPAPARLSHPVRLSFEPLHLQLQVVHAVFGAEQVRWESGQAGDKAWLDVVLYAGELKDINLASLNEAVIGLVLEMDTKPPASFGVKKAGEKTRMNITWDGLNLSIPMRPAKASELQKAYQGIVE